MCDTGCVNVKHKDVFVEVQNDKCKIKRNTLNHIFTQIYLYEKSCELLEKTIHYVSPLVKKNASKECLSFLEGIHEGAHHFHQACHASFFIYDILSLISILKKIKKEKTQGEINNIDNFIDLSGPKALSEKLLKYVIIITRVASHGLYAFNFLQELKIANSPIKTSKYIQILKVINFSAQTIVFFNKIGPKLLDKENKKSFLNKLHFSHLIVKTSGLISSTVSVMSKLKYFNEYSNLLKLIKKTSGLVNTLFVYWSVVPKSQESYHINLFESTIVTQ